MNDSSVLKRSGLNWGTDQSDEDFDPFPTKLSISDTPDLGKRGIDIKNKYVYEVFDNKKGPLFFND